MRTTRTTFSLPKAQPTKSSSCGNIYTQKSLTDYKAKRIYVHKLSIDYGHIQIPEQIKKRLHKQKYQQPQSIRYVNQESDTLDIDNICKETEINETVRTIHKNQSYQNIKVTGSSSKTEGSSNKSNIYDDFNNSAKDQKLKRTKQFNPEQTTKVKIALRLKQVYALENNLNRTDQKPNYKKNCQHTIQSDRIEQTVNNIQRSFIEQLSTIENLHTAQTHPNESVNQSYRSNTERKKLHSRIVKTYVAGSKMQMKIINYPDNSDYVKLCAGPNQLTKLGGLQKSKFRN